MNGSKLQIKTEPDIVEIKKEDIESDSSEDESENSTKFISDGLETNNGNYIVKQVKSEPTDSDIDNNENIKTEDHSSDEDDHFIETCVKSTRDDPGQFDNNHVDDEFFNKEYKEAYIKDEIEVEEHEIKLEIDENDLQNPQKPEKHDLKNIKTKLKCDSCDFETPFRNYLKKHSLFHEDPSKILYHFCTRCSYSTRQKGHLKRHELVHQNSGEVSLFQCYICDLKTKQKSTLKRHINHVHMNQPREKDGIKYYPNANELHTCDKCSYKTYKKSLLLSHLDKHKDPSDVSNLYICDICSFSTKYRRNLRMHMITHRESQELQIYKCKLCSFKTRICYCLKRHLLSKKHLLAAGKIKEYCPRPQKS